MKTFLKVIGTLVKWYLILDVIVWAIAGVLDLAGFYLTHNTPMSMDEYVEQCSEYWQEKIEKISPLLNKG